MRNCVID